MSNNLFSTNLRLIQDVVHVRQSGLRSINVERDLGKDNITEGYVLTGQARASLDRILKAFANKTPTRSWILTGPYGSGKSFFGLFMMNLMEKTQFSHHFSFKQLEKADRPLAQRLQHTLNFDKTKGLLPIPITGHRAPLQSCLKHALLQLFGRLDGNGKIPLLLKKLQTWTPHTESKAIINWLKDFLHLVTQAEFGYLGIIFIFDEMGKALEFAASRPAETDIYLLQELAEFANRSEKTPLVFVGILHQSFEQYAHLLDAKTQREWNKIQDRFDDIPFQEPIKQQIRLLSNIIEYTDWKSLSSIKPILQQTTQSPTITAWCPPLMQPEEFAEMAMRSYPIHPTALATLPFLFRRLAQNERSIFVYLSSHEPGGFQEFIRQNPIGNFIQLPHLFDYLVANFQNRLYASGRARAITETIERLNNQVNLSDIEINVLKTIGVLNWLSEVSPLQATLSNIISALRSTSATDNLLNDAIRNLHARSLIIYRKFNRTYKIWHGSDLDIEGQLQRAQQQLHGSFGLASATQKYLTPRPVVARRHSYQTGTLRYFEVIYVDALSLNVFNSPLPMDISGRVFLCLSLNQTDVELFTKLARENTQQNVIFGVPERIERLTDQLYELNCLHWVEENTPELRDDSIARRELRTRQQSIESTVQNSIDRTLAPYRLSNAYGCRWFQAGKEVSGKANHGLSHLLSEVCDQFYHKSPILWNEILNRRVLSSQGAAARRDLIEAILTCGEKEALGIEGFPPARSMYDSILKASGLHRRNSDDVWGFAPLPKDDPLHLQPVWDAIEQFIFTDSPEHKPISELYQILSRAPYGLTDGVLPVLLCVFVILNQGEITLYQEGTLLPEMSVAHWEVLLRRPDLYSIAGCKVTGTRLAIVQRFARAYQVSPQTMPVVRSLIRGIKSLPEHTLRTNRLSLRTRALRQTLEQARSPELLLFTDLPAALEIPPFEHRTLVNEQVALFFERLNESLTDLSNEMSRLLSWGRDQVLTACGLEPGDENWRLFCIQASNLAKRSSHVTLLPLLKRAAETPDPFTALESVLAYVANRPPRSWTDSDTDRFVIQVKVLGDLFKNNADNNANISSLSDAEKTRSFEVMKDLRQYLLQLAEQNPKILQAALQNLSQEYLKKLDN